MTADGKLRDAPQKPATVQGQSNPNGLVGLVLSAIGLAGWIVTLVLIFSFRHEQLTGDGPRDMIIRLGNFLTYLVQVATGFVGLVVCGFFSATGLIVSGIGMSQESRRQATIGLVLGLAGLFIGLCLILWRMIAWGLLT